MGTVEHLLDRKGRAVHTISPDATVLQASRLMNEHRIGSLVVTDAGRLVGIFTERDVLRRVVSEQRNPSTSKVSDVMTTTVACASPHTRLAEVRRVMFEKRIRHLPVVDETDEVVGMVSIGDVNRAENSEQEETIRYLARYMYVP